MTGTATSLVSQVWSVRSRFFCFQLLHFEPSGCHSNLFFFDRLRVEEKVQIRKKSSGSVWPWLFWFTPLLPRKPVNIRRIEFSECWLCCHQYAWSCNLLNSTCPWGVYTHTRPYCNWPNELVFKCMAIRPLHSGRMPIGVDEPFWTSENQKLKRKDLFHIQKRFSWNWFIMSSWQADWVEALTGPWESEPGLHLDQLCLPERSNWASGVIVHVQSH